MSTPPNGKAGLSWDTIAGVLMMAVAVAFLTGAWNLRLGTLSKMGPGFAPTAMCVILFGLGLLLAVQGHFQRGDAPQWPRLRPALVVIVCPILFALLIGWLGLVLTVIIVTCVARLAQPQEIGLEMIVLPVLLTLFCVVVFVKMLSLTIPLWP